MSYRDCKRKKPGGIQYIIMQFYLYAELIVNV